MVDEYIRIKQNRTLRKPKDREQRVKKSREVRAAKPLVEKPTGMVHKIESEAVPGTDFFKYVENLDFGRLSNGSACFLHLQGLLKSFKIDVETSL